MHRTFLGKNIRLIFDLLGQNIAKKLLKAMVQQRVQGRSIFLEGPPHVGKMHTCLLIAMGFFCEQKAHFGCGECDPCKNILQGSHPKVIVLSNEDLTVQLQRLCEFFQQYFEKISDQKGFLRYLVNLAWRAIYQSQFFVDELKEKELSLWEKVFSLMMSVEALPFEDAIKSLFMTIKTLREVQKLPIQISKNDVLRFLETCKFSQQQGSIYIIQNMQSLHSDSVFMLLKFLEDSLQNNLFFFLSHSRNTVMDPIFCPILSRCLCLSFSSLSEKTKLQILQQCFFINFSKDPETDKSISHSKSRSMDLVVDFFAERNQNVPVGFSPAGVGWHDVLLCRWISSALYSNRASGGALGVYGKVGGFVDLESHKRG